MDCSGKSLELIAIHIIPLMLFYTKNQQLLFQLSISEQNVSKKGHLNFHIRSKLFSFKNLNWFKCWLFFFFPLASRLQYFNILVSLLEQFIQENILKLIQYSR